MKMKESPATSSRRLVMSQEDFFIWFPADKKANSNFRSDSPRVQRAKTDTHFKDHFLF